MLSRFGLPLIGKVCTQHPEMHLQIREEGSLVLDELLTSGKIELSISATRPEGVVIGEEILTEAIVLMYPPSLSLPDDPRPSPTWPGCPGSFRGVPTPFAR